MDEKLTKLWIKSNMTDYTRTDKKQIEGGYKYPQGNVDLDFIVVKPCNEHKRFMQKLQRLSVRDATQQ